MAPKRGKQIKRSAVPYFWTKNSLEMSGLDGGSPYVLTPLLPQRFAELEQNKVLTGKIFDHWGIQICQNQGPIFSPLSGKNAIIFGTIWVALVGNKAGHMFKGRDQNYS